LILHLKAVAEAAFGVGVFVFREEPEADGGLRAVEELAGDRRGVFLGLEAGIGAELIGGVPQAFFKSGGIRVFFGWRYPLHVRNFLRY